MKRSLRFLVRFFVWGLIGLGLATVVFLGRLSTGPVPLGWIKPRIEEALRPANDDHDVVIGRTELRLTDDHSTVELIGIDVRYLDQDQQPFLVFPEVKVALSIEALLKHGMIAASMVEARAPFLQLSRAADGRIGLYSLNAAGGPEEAEVDFAGFLRQVVRADGGDDRLAFLKRLQIQGGRIAFEDETRTGRLHAENANLVVTRQQNGDVSGWLTADLVQHGQRTAVRLHGRKAGDAERLALTMTLKELVVADMARAWRQDFPDLPDELMQINFPIDASIEGALELDGTLSPLDLKMTVADAVLKLPAHLDEPLPITHGELRGALLLDRQAFAIEHLTMSSLGAALVAKGRISWRDGAESVALDLTAKNVSADSLARLWPQEAGDNARAWVLKNIQEGRVPEAEAKLLLLPEDFDEGPLRDEALKGRFSFEGLSVRYIETMPPIIDASGEVTFDADHLHFDVAGGDNAGVTITGGTVTIMGMGKPGDDAKQLKALADVEGPVARGLALLNHPPLTVAQDLDITPDRTSGDFRAKLDIRMPLHDDVDKEEVDVLAEATLKALAIDGLPRLGDDVQLREGDFQLLLRETQILLDGTALLADLPLSIRIEEPVDQTAGRRRIILNGRVSPAALARLDLADKGIGGGLIFDATVTETEHNLWVDLEADLTGLRIAMPGFRWNKAPGTEGTLQASIAIPQEAPIDVKWFELKTDELLARGNLRLSPEDYEVEALTLDQFQIGESRGTLRIEGQGTSSRRITVVADYLDLDHLLADEDKDVDIDHDQFHIAMRADRLSYKGLDLRNLQADAAYRDGLWQTASLLGDLAEAGKVALELVPGDEGQRLEVRSDDAGALIQALDFGNHVQGGSFHLTADLASQDPLAATGRVRIRNFMLEDAPLLARLLTVASFTGIVNLLEGEGIGIDLLRLPFAIKDQRLVLNDGLLRGSEIGLTAKGAIDFDADTIDLAGTIIPIYSLNRLLGKVPIIGRILTGQDGEGAFAATYTMVGPDHRPVVSVNPLSILAPGLLRDFFGSLANGTADNADGAGASK